MTDTIAALATASGGGVGIVRLSGPGVERILRALVPTLPRPLPSHRLVLGEVLDPATGAVLDEVLVTLMRAPRSYTGEDVGELHGHGGSANLARLLSAVLSSGARLATPGEFTRRAFVAGKLDLSQAEAVAAIIGARDARSLVLAQALRRGALGQAVEAARRSIVLSLAELEGALDFPDETAGEPGGDSSALPPARITELRGHAEAFERARAGYQRPLGQLPEILLVGLVNAGKSSLLNALCGQERALVDASPGTTRDLVEAELLDPELGLLRLIDTAGLRETPSALEARGQALAAARLEGAALVLFVFDGAAGWRADDQALHERLIEGPCPVLVVRNKADLGPGPAGPRPAVTVSTRTGAGLPALWAAVRQALASASPDELPVANARQAAALGSAQAALALAIEALVGSALGPIAPEVAAVELRRALNALGALTGETVEEEVLDALFARFCLGK